jgi:hypothetical protein
MTHRAEPHTINSPAMLRNYPSFAGNLIATLVLVSVGESAARGAHRRANTSGGLRVPTDRGVFACHMS